MLEYKGYLGVIEREDDVFVGRVVGLRDVITFEAAISEDLEIAFRASIDDYLAFCRERGEVAERPA